MKKKFTLLLAAFALLATVLLPLRMVGQTWTREESVLKTLTFPDDNHENNGLTSNQYQSTWTAMMGIDSWTISNFNNNNWNNNWTFIKCGRKNNASVGTIITSNAFSDAISKVVVTIDACNASKVNSQKLYVATDADFTSNLQTIAVDIATGENTFTIPTPTANCYYKLEYDCQAGSSNGLVTISQVDYYGNSGGSTTPSISANNVNIAHDATSGSISYTISNPTSATLSATCTESWVSNIAVTSSAVTFNTTQNTSGSARTATFTLAYTGATNKTVTVTQAAAPVIYTTIPDLFAAATSAGSTATNVTVTFGNWVVSGVSTNGKNVFVTDGTNGFVIFNNNGNLGFTVGDVISGTAACKVQLYNGFAEITQLTSSTEGISIATGGTVTAANIEMANLAGINTGALVHYDNLTCSVDNNKYYLSDGTTTLQVYNSLFADTYTNLEADKSYNITGVYQQYNTTKEILPRSADDIVEATAADPELTVSATELSDFTYTLGNGPSAAKSFTVSGSNLTANVTVTAPTNFQVCATANGTYANSLTLNPTAGTLNTTTVYVRMIAGLAVNSYSGNLTVTSTGATSKTVALSGSVTAMPVVETPTFSPAEGTYTETQNVTIACATDGATIRYTLDGTDPTSSSTAYSTAIAISTTTTVKAKAFKSGHEDSEVATATYTIVTPAQETEYTLITNASALIAGDKYIIVGLKGEEYKALGKQNTNNRIAVDVTPASNVITITPATLAGEDAVYELTLGQENGHWTLYDAANGGYLYAASSSANYLKTQPTNDANGEWTIEIASDGAATITAQGTNSRNLLKFNSSSNLFSCYASGQQAVYLYKAGDMPTAPALTASVSQLSDFNYAAGSGPSEAQYFTISGNDLTENVTVTAPTNFEVCTTKNGTFASTLTLTPTAGVIDADTVYVRMVSGLSVNTYTGDLTATSGSLSATVTLNGSVTTMPVAATPTFSLEEGSFMTAQSVSIESTTEGATIYYTLDGTDPTTSSSVYSTELTISETTTLKAIAAKEGYENSPVASATYTIFEPMDIADVRALADNTMACVEGTVIFIDGRNIYIQNGDAGIDLYLNNNTVPDGIALGDNVRAYGKKTVYKGLVELSNIDGGDENAFAILSSGNELPLNETDIAEINADFAADNLMQSTRVKIEYAIIGAINPTSTTVITQDGESINVYRIPEVEGLEQGDYVTLTAVISCYNTPQLLVASADDIEFTHRPTIIATPTSVSGMTYDYNDGGPSNIVSFLLAGHDLHGRVYVYPSEHFEVSTFEDFVPENPASVSAITGSFYDINIYVRLMDSLPGGTYTEQLTLTSPDADTVYVTVSGTVTGGTTPTPPTPTGDGDYVRISDLSQLANGSQVIIAARHDNVATSYYAMSNATSGKPEGVAFTSTTSDGNEILPASIVDEESNYYWMVGMNGSNYTFTNANGELIGWTTSTNFVTGGDNTEWSIESSTAGDGAMVPGYNGFVIKNFTDNSRAFALNNNHNFGPYSFTANGNNSGYNFYLDFFVKTEGSGTQTVATPTFSPEAGTYFEAQTVTISCATDSATIRYTIDGTEPDSTSLVYSSPLTISETTTIKAIAMKAGYNNSAVATALYTIQAGSTIIFNQDWEDDWNGWTQVSVAGDSTWRISQYNGNHYAYMNAYNDVANEDWLISPAFNVDEIGNPILTFRTARKYTGPDIEVFFSNNYNGTTPGTATWQPLTCTLSTGNNWNWAESGNISLSSFTGTNCHIAFKYTSTDSQAAGWEVDDIMLVAQTTDPTISATPTALNGFNYIVGNGPSAEQSLNVSAINLTANLTITGTTNYEISTVSGSGFNAQSTITLTPASGAIDTTIYVRLKAGLEVGNYENETIVLASAGAASVNGTCNGTVSEQPQPGTGDYVRINALSELADGDRIILASRYNPTATAYKAVANTLTSGKLGTTEFTSAMSGTDEILPEDIANNEDSYYWTVNIASGSYTFTNANGQTISYNSQTNFNFTGDKTAWTVAPGAADSASLVPYYAGFSIVNVNTDTRAFALRVTESNSVVGAYSTSNMNNAEYNFFLDIFRKGEGGGTPTVAIPTFSPAAGTYYAAQEVTINCATDGATIHFSTTSENGPWTEYEDAITVAESTTIWAYASKDEYNDSPVASASYVINTNLNIIFNQDWEGDWNGWTQVSVAGDSTWRIKETSGNHYAYINAYQDVANEDWLISPAFDLDSYTGVVLTFRTARNYNGNEIEVFFSNDYDGSNPTTATWQPLACALSQGSWNWVESGSISLDGYSGNNCFIAYKYTCTEDEAAAWEVDDIMLTSDNAGIPSITATPNALDFEYLVGQGPSASKTYILTSANLEGQGNVSVTVSDNFQIALDNANFGSSLSLEFANGIITNQPLTVYVRMAAGLASGTYTGTITHNGGGATETVTLTGIVIGEGEPYIESIVPLYIQGNNGSNNNRVPVATEVFVHNLAPNTTYRYTNQFVDSNDGPETAGAGNVIYADADRFYRSTSPSLATEGGYGLFTTDEEGKATVWCVNEPTANARFTPGNQVYLRIRVNDGNDGTSVAYTFTSQDYATVLNFGTERDEYQGTAFYAKSVEAPRGFAMMYAQADELRPVYATSIETVGVDYSSINQYANFYKELVAGNDGWFGGILPNDNESGINYIAIVKLDGTSNTIYSTENGFWQPEGNTVNPNGGLETPIFIDLTYTSVEEGEDANVTVWNTGNEFVIENADESHYVMTVYNLLGQPMMQRQVNANSIERISHNLASGLYIINLQNSRNKVAAKVIVK